MKPEDQRRPNEWPYEYFYLGIFDGHGGYEAASYAKEHLLKAITKQDSFWSDDDEDVKRAIRMGFAECHRTMREEMSDWSRTSRVLPSTAGTTASILFIRNGKFYTGHVGDSRIVIAQEHSVTKQWISQQLTEDHKPESDHELERIKRAGGEVRSKLGVHRVVWRRPVLHDGMEQKLRDGPMSTAYGDFIKQVPTYPVPESHVSSYQVIPFLAIGRSLGDFWSINPISGQYIVSPEPDITCRPIKSTDRAIILATDGLWNVINSSLSVRILQELNMKKNGTPKEREDEYFTVDNFYDVAGKDSENHAQSLVYIAYQVWERKRLRSDNITVVVAMLHDILAHFRNDKTAQLTPPSVELSSPNQDSNHTSTRAILRSSDKKLQAVDLNTCNLLEKPRPVQINESRSYLGKIRLNSEPDIENYSEDKVITEIRSWQRIEDYLVLPPTLLDGDREALIIPPLDHPPNYTRLSTAACRKIENANPDELSYGDNFIYIKNVSDDPSDRHQQPLKTSEKGKLVRDASSQATQPMHDFGQPWDQLTHDITNKNVSEDSEDMKIDDGHQWNISWFRDQLLKDVFRSEKDKAEPNQPVESDNDIATYNLRNRRSISRSPANSPQVGATEENNEENLGDEFEGRFNNNEDEADMIQECLEVFRNTRLVKYNVPLGSDTVDSVDANSLELKDKAEDVDDESFEEITLEEIGQLDTVNEPDEDELESDEDLDFDQHIDVHNRQNLTRKEKDIIFGPQLRCILNSSGQQRRTRRRVSSHLSRSENSKRKNRLSNGGNTIKRRRSQPIVCCSFTQA